MKRAMWTAILMAGTLLGAPAQESGKTVAVDPGGPPPTSMAVWAAHTGANAVRIRTPGNPSTFITALTGAAYGFNQPWDIVHLPSRTLVFVTNAGNGTVTVINSDTTQAVSIVDLATPFNGRNLGGLSVSAGEDEVFVAGADLNGAAIFRISVPSLVASRVGGKAGPPADDCAAIRAGTSGGSGNATRKIYFTQRATNELSEINLGAGGAVSTVVLGAAPLNQVLLPDNMDRTSDHRFVFVACSRTFPVGDSRARTVRIDPSVEPIGAAVSQPTNANGLTDDAHRVMDISFGTGPGGVNRGFALVLFDPNATTTRVVVEIDETGAFVPGATPTATAGGVTPSTIRFASSTEQLFVGELPPGTSNSYNVFNAKFGSPITFQNTVVSGATQPGHFALVPMPQPIISDMSPRGALAGAAPGTNIVTIHGAGFLDGALFDSGAGPQLVNFIDSNTVTVDLSGAGAATLGGAITNPNALSASFDLYYRRYAPEVLGSYSITFPPATGGYAMYSVPQYIGVTAFKAALAAQLGPYNPVLYRVFFYRNNRYVELNTMADDGCDLAGEAFWMITRNGGTVTFAGPDVRQNQGGFSRIIPLAPGFNMVSVPMTGDLVPPDSINWASVLVTSDQTNFGSAISAPTAVAILAPAALEFVGGSYVTADPLVTGRGYWIENITSQPAYLVFATTAVNKPSAAPSSGGGPPPPGMKPPAPPSAGISDGSSGGFCGFTGAEVLLALLAARVFHRARRVRKLIA